MAGLPAALIISGLSSVSAAAPSPYHTVPVLEQEVGCSPGRPAQPGLVWEDAASGASLRAPGISWMSGVLVIAPARV